MEECRGRSSTSLLGRSWIDVLMLGPHLLPDRHLPSSLCRARPLWVLASRGAWCSLSPGSASKAFSSFCSCLALEISLALLLLVLSKRGWHPSRVQSRQGRAYSATARIERCSWNSRGCRRWKLNPFQAAPCPVQSRAEVVVGLFSQTGSASPGPLFNATGHPAPG